MSPAYIAIIHVAGLCVALSLLVSALKAIDAFICKRWKKALYQEVSLALRIPIDEINNEANEERVFDYLARKYNQDLLVNRISDFCGLIQNLWESLGTFVTFSVIAVVIWCGIFENINLLENIWFAFLSACFFLISSHVLALCCLVLLGRLPRESYKARKKLQNDIPEARNTAALSPLACQFNASEKYDLGKNGNQGEGVAREITEAAKWLRKASENNDAEAQYEIGLIYHLGRGVPKDYAEALIWYRKAAEQDVAKAQYNIGTMYGKGEGVVKDDIEMVKWLRKAAERGDAAAQYYLAACYVGGIGVPKDEVAAYSWLLLAGQQAFEEGFDQVKEYTSSIESGLTPAQRAEGQRLAFEFQRIQKSN